MSVNTKAIHELDWGSTTWTQNGEKGARVASVTTKGARAGVTTVDTCRAMRAARVGMNRATHTDTAGAACVGAVGVARGFGRGGTQTRQGW